MEVLLVHPARLPIQNKTLNGFFPMLIFSIVLKMLRLLFVLEIKI